MLTTPTLRQDTPPAGSTAIYWPRKAESTACRRARWCLRAELRAELRAGLRVSAAGTQSGCGVKQQLLQTGIAAVVQPRGRWRCSLSCCFTSADDLEGR